MHDAWWDNETDEMERMGYADGCDVCGNEIGPVTFICDCCGARGCSGCITHSGDDVTGIRCPACR